MSIIYYIIFQCTFYSFLLTVSACNLFINISHHCRRRNFIYAPDILYGNRLPVFQHCLNMALGGFLDISQCFIPGLSPRSAAGQGWNPDTPAAVFLFLKCYLVNIGIQCFCLPKIPYFYYQDNTMLEYVNIPIIKIMFWKV